MPTLIVLATATAPFTIYPGNAAPDPRIEAVTRRGPIYELIVKCPSGTAILSYSPIEQRYCTPKWSCMANREAAIAESCGAWIK